MGQVLIDTCVLIDYSRGRPAARDFLLKLSSDPLVSVITVAEMFAGVRDGRERAWLETWIEDLDVLQISAEIAKLGGLYYRDHRPRHGTSLTDALIAATARVHGARLVTCNVRHFPMLDDLLVPYQ